MQALGVATGLVVAAAFAAPPREESDQVAFEAGRIDAIKNVHSATAFGLEYRVGPLLGSKLRLFFGAGMTTQHSVYGYGGMRLSTYWGERIVVSPSFALGGYRRGAGKDLGEPPLVGRFGLDLEYRFDNEMRFGVGYHHLSNGNS